MDMQEDFGKAKIKIIGVGGGGNNAVARMIDAGIKGVEFIIVNTDAQPLQDSKADVKIQIGKNITKGLGAGANPDIGKRAAEETKEEIKKHIEGADMVFITAGMGGGTGTGAAPVIAEITKSLDILTVAVVTRPFMFEGRSRARKAEQGIKLLSENVDSIVTIKNDNLLKATNNKDTIEDAFRYADEVLRQGVQGITDIIQRKGLINSDFADVRATMKDSGVAHMGIGVASGDNASQEAVKNAIESPILDTTIDGAHGVLLYVIGGTLTLMEANEIGQMVHSMVNEDAEIIFGASIDENLGDEIQVTLIATALSSDSMTNNAKHIVTESINQTVEPQIYGRNNTQTVQPETTAEAAISDEDGAIRKMSRIKSIEVPSFKRRNQ
ncbi:MAG: cell division protein FtsZ [Oscillospiraceae bacterium]|nr:cell division protein FtsZ [Oscillospiraceae bacterium]